MDSRIVVFVLESVTLEGEILHFLVVECTDCFDVGTFRKRFQLLFGLVNFENLFYAVEVVSHVVLVLEHLKGAVNLVLVHFLNTIN